MVCYKLVVDWGNPDFLTVKIILLKLILLKQSNISEAITRWCHEVFYMMEEE